MISKSIIFLSALTCVMSCSTNKNKTLYTHGEPSIERKFDKNCGCTIEKQFYKSGKLLSLDYRYANPKNPSMSFLNGPSIRYFENGKINVYHYYNKGELDNIGFALFENGDTAYLNHYKNGYKSGTWKVFDEQKNLLTETDYDEGSTPVNSDKDYFSQKLYDLGKAYQIKRVENGSLIWEESIDTTLYVLKEQTRSGRMIFIANCSMCHSMDRNIVGPKLKGVTGIRKEDWLRKFILDGAALYKSGDPLAVELYNKWQKTEHPSHTYLNKEELNKIINYLKENS